MKPNIFMSYSRREVGFVDDLTHRLEKAGFNIWLDYRRLIPGTPWAGQIDKGLKEAEVVLLVVSKDSIASQYVELEWRHVLNEKNKRILLAIFEAVKLPPELKNYEWVDFRGSYGAGIKELIAQLKSPIQEAHPVPETGFKAPFIVWLTIVLSALAGLYSLYAFWTVLLPLILVPLAWRVYKRSYNFSHVQTALWMLPILNVLGLVLLYEVGLLGLDPYPLIGFYVDHPFMWTVLELSKWLPHAMILLFFLFRMPGMQRWGKPEANMLKFANPYRPNNPNPKPIKFFIDHTGQDSVMARDISKRLSKYGHSPAADLSSAEVVFVLISRFKTDTAADPEQQVVFPVLVQTAQPSEKLSHVQWIDFRKGLHNLNAMAQLLPEPANMLAALGVRPTSGAQTVLPNIIASLVNFLTFMMVFDLACFIAYILELSFNGLADMIQYDAAAVYGNLALSALTVILACALDFFMIKALTERRGWLASMFPFLLAVCGLFALIERQLEQTYSLAAVFADYGIGALAGFANLPVVFFLIGGFFLAIAACFRFGDIRRWFPAKAK
jgi:TIR domain